MNRQRGRELADATAEHRRREDEAPRLRDEVADLLSLRLKFSDIRPEGRMLAVSYTRPIVVASAPAYFDIRCMEPRCEGRHDLTRQIMRCLRLSQVTFAGTSDCTGSVGDEPCDRVLAYECEASYRS